MRLDEDFLQALQALLRANTNEADDLAKRLALDAGWILTLFYTFDNEKTWQLTKRTNFPDVIVYLFIRADRISDLCYVHPDDHQA
jgi:hypothetical protein